MDNKDRFKQYDYNTNALINTSCVRQKEDFDITNAIIEKFNYNSIDSFIDDKLAIPGIKKVIFNPPATIVIWDDGSKTFVKSSDENYDPEKGLAMVISKKALGNKGNYYNVFKKWLPTEEQITDQKCFIEKIVDSLKSNLLSVSIDKEREEK